MPLVTASLYLPQIKAIQKGQDEFKGQTESAIKELKDDIKGRISIQTYWFLGIITFLVGFLGKFVFWPPHNP